MISGILNVYKEKGYTSHDVVAKLRGILGQRRIGHTGTLDPEAEGVLPVCLGVGTRLCDLLTDTGKMYRAVLLLGQETDTQDSTGTVLATYPVHVTEEEAAACIASFVGEYDQIPPMYSALKVQGKKLYELARAGVEVERAPRRVTVHAIRVEEICLPRITMTVDCSKGTYIRTLCHDIGKRLGTGGCMESLTRTRVGCFDIAESLTLSRIETLRDQGKLTERIHPVDSMFPELPRVLVTSEAERLLKNGNLLRSAQLLAEGTGAFAADPEAAPRLRVYDTESRFCGIYRWDRHRNGYVPEKMFLSPAD